MKMKCISTELSLKNLFYFSFYHYADIYSNMQFKLSPNNLNVIRIRKHFTENPKKPIYNKVNLCQTQKERGKI